MDDKLSALRSRAAALSAAPASSDARIGYKTMREGIAEQNDCAVRALHMATRMSYTESHALLARFGRADGKGTQFVTTFVPAAVAAGLERHSTQSRTLGQFLKAEGARGIWVIGMTDHFATYVDGRCVSDSWGTGLRTRLHRAYIWKAAD